MGKSPGKWIKTLLFGKKASKSNLSKGREVLRKANENETWVAAKDPGVESAVHPTLISHAASSTTDGNEGSSALAKVVPSNGQPDGDVLSRNQDPDFQRTTGPEAANDPERIRQEQAATKAQAAFRGYLARRAFRALKGIIRLQALIRGHLVRRQAVATLRCMQGIVRFQALVRGRRIRNSDTGLEVHRKCNVRKVLICRAFGLNNLISACKGRSWSCSPLGALVQQLNWKSDGLQYELSLHPAKEEGGLTEAEHLDPIRVNSDLRTKMVLENAFAVKLLASTSTAMPLRLQYGLGEPNSAWNWLERWTSAYFCKPVPRAKKNADAKPQARQVNLQSAETERGRSKRTVRKLPAAHVDNGSTHSTTESEKPKRGTRKVTTHPVDSVPDPQTELEKVKRNLRKVSSSIIEASDRVEVEIEKPKRVLRNLSSPTAADASEQGVGDSTETIKKDTVVEAPKKPDVEATEVPLISDEPVENVIVTNHDAGVQAVERTVQDENTPVTNGELNSKEDHTGNINMKSSKRRASFPAKQEYPENGLRNTPALPSYMAATESAKAKLRVQGSPRFGQDGVERNGLTRRHSLPSSTNGKMNSDSPRTQRLVNGNGKVGVRDRSLLSSRDNNDKVVQAEWRR